MEQDGGDFDALHMSVQVSLANLPDATYEPIGRAISGLLVNYRREWLSLCRLADAP